MPRFKIVHVYLAREIFDVEAPTAYQAAQWFEHGHPDSERAWLGNGTIEQLSSHSVLIGDEDGQLLISQCFSMDVPSTTPIGKLH